jgi:hypothetical protein
MKKRPALDSASQASRNATLEQKMIGCRRRQMQDPRHAAHELACKGSPIVFPPCHHREMPFSELCRRWANPLAFSTDYFFCPVDASASLFHDMVSRLEVFDCLLTFSSFSELLYQVLFTRASAQSHALLPSDGRVWGGRWPFVCGGDGGSGGP